MTHYIYYMTIFYVSHPRKKMWSSSLSQQKGQKMDLRPRGKRRRLAWQGLGMKTQRAQRGCAEFSSTWTSGSEAGSFR